nr:transcription factor [Fagopyrum tataricum]
MNDYLSILSSLMPPSYSLRGDQASIVGGAINFVKKLEQLLQYRKSNNIHSLFTEFFSFPQYSTTATGEEPPEVVADVEVAVVERHVTVKVLSRKKPKQLLRMLIEMESAHLTILHLNVTSIDEFVLYSFSLKKEDECQLNTVNEIATAVYEMIRRIQRHSEFEIQPLQTLARTRSTMENPKTSLEQL